MRMENKQKVSVIVPVYNVENYIEECIESIVSQTYTNLEIILVIDGSTDASEEICRRYEKRDHRIKLILQENQGLSGARNTGISAASGSLLSFVDSDDFLDGQMIEKMVNSLEESNAQMAVCGMYRYYSWTNKVRKSVSNKKVLSGGEVLESILTEDVIGNYSCNKLVKRTLFDGILYPVGKVFEDVFTIYKVVGKCERICVIPDALYYYRQRESSLAHEISKKAYCDQIEAFFSQAKDISVQFPDLRQTCEEQLMRSALRLFDAGAAWKTADKTIFEKLKNEVRQLPDRTMAALSYREYMEYYGMLYYPHIYCCLRRITYLLKRRFRRVLYN